MRRPRRPARCERVSYDLGATDSFISYFLSIASQISAFAQADPRLDFRRRLQSGEEIEYSTASHRTSYIRRAWLPIGGYRASLG